MPGKKVHGRVSFSIRGGLLFEHTMPAKHPVQQFGLSARHCCRVRRPLLLAPRQRPETPGVRAARGGDHVAYKGAGFW